MDYRLLTVSIFLAIACGIAAVLLLVRDLVSANGALAGKWKLRFLPPVPTNDATSLSGRVDRTFHQISIETGSQISPSAAYLFVLLWGLAVGGAVFLWQNDLMQSGLAAAVGIAIGYLVLAYRRARWKGAVRDQLPDVFDLLGRAVRAGESLDQAIELVGDKAREPLAVEFRRCAKQLQMGLSVHHAMSGLTGRVPLPEMQIFATTLAVHRQAGGNLATTLERMAAVVRDRLNYQRQLRATTAAGRFSTMFIAMIGPCIFAFLVIFRPAYIQHLLVEPIGQMMLVIAVVLEIIGLVWIARMIRSTY